MPTNSRSRAQATARRKTGNGSADRTHGGNGAHDAMDCSAASSRTLRRALTSRRIAPRTGLAASPMCSATPATSCATKTKRWRSYVDMASDQLRRFADQIRQKGVADMMDDVHNFARRRPALFIGGAFLVGLGIARFLKSSAERGLDERQTSGFSDVDPMTHAVGAVVRHAQRLRRRPAVTARRGGIRNGRSTHGSIARRVVLRFVPANRGADPAGDAAGEGRARARRPRMSGATR